MVRANEFEIEQNDDFFSNSYIVVSPETAETGHFQKVSARANFGQISNFGEILGFYTVIVIQGCVTPKIGKSADKNKLL